MTPLASSIRADIASLQDEIKKLRRSAKRDLSDSANLRSVSADLRERIARVKDLERNLAAEETNF
jgi:phage shock protein A